MKTITKLLFKLLLIATIVSCNKNDEINVLDVVIIDNYNYNFFAQDSINYFKLDDFDNPQFLSKCNRSNNHIVWSIPIVAPQNQTVDLGYGKTVLLDDSNPITIFDGNKNLCYITHRSNKDQKEYGYGNNVGVYSLDGTFLNNINIAYPNYFTNIMRWTNNRFILLLGPTSDNFSSKYIMIGVDGDIDEEKNTKLLYVDKNPFILNDYQYVAIQNNNIFICDLRSGTTKLSDLAEYYKHRFPNESNAPHLTINLKKYDNNFLNIDVNILFYSGLTTTEHLSVNITTGEVIQEV